MQQLLSESKIIGTFTKQTNLPIEVQSIQMISYHLNEVRLQIIHLSLKIIKINKIIQQSRKNYLV